MSVEHNIVKSLKVVARDGSLKLDASGKVVLVGGAGFSVVKDDTEDRAFVINADLSAGAGTDYYIRKYDAVINGCGGGCPPEYTFSGIASGGYWVSRINQKAPYKPSGAFCISGGACGQLGEFPVVSLSGGSPVQAVVESAAATLSITDMCMADIDCEDYYRLFSKIKIIKDYLDNNKDKNLDQAGSTRLFPQYEAAVHMWNYLANLQGIIFKVKASGGNIKVDAGYRAMACGPYSGVFWAVTATQVSGQSGLSTTPAVTSKDASRVELVAETSLSGSTLIAIVDGMFGMNEYSVVSSTIRVRAPSDESSSSSSMPGSSDAEPLNEWLVVGSFYNTHLGVPVTLTKRIFTEPVS